MQFTDRQPLPQGRRTANGYFVIEANVARPGIQIYTGDEMGRPDMAEVRVYRPPEEVFSDESLITFAHKPVTFTHPDDPVSSHNDRALRVGHIGSEVGAVETDKGKFIRVPMMLTDEATIKKAEDGINELSMGYKAKITFQDGFTPEGDPFDAIQSDIKINHLAIVSEARGGPELKLGDGNTNGGSGMTDATTTIVRDKMSAVVPADQAQLIDRMFADADQKIADGQAEIDALKKDIETKKGKLAQMEKDAKEAEDAKPSDEDLDKRADTRGKLKNDARAILGKDANFDGQSTANIKRAVVMKTLGDAAKDFSDEAIAGAYEAAVATASASNQNQSDQVAKMFDSGSVRQANDGLDAWAHMLPKEG